MSLRSWMFAGVLVCGSQAAAHPVAEAFAKNLRTLEGQFVQRVLDPRGELREESTGQVALAAPRQFRWDYEAPFPQTIVADGDRVWVFDPDLEQVTVRQQSHEEQSSPLAALIDPDVLEQQFVVSEGGKADGLDWILLVPRKTDDAAFSEAQLGFDGEQLRRMQLVDSLQQRTIIEFSAWKRNQPLPPNHFHFVPPAGVDVIGDPGQGAEVLPLQD